MDGLFSIVFATRQRVQLLERLLYSIEQYSVGPVEVIAVADVDDTQTQAAIPRLSARFPFVNILSRDRSRRLNDDYLNWATSKTRGKYVLILNDDTEVATPKWDLLAKRKIEEYLADKPDRIVMALPDDSLNPDFRSRQGCGHYGSFPILTRESIAICGWAMPPWFNSWGADVSIFQIYSHVGRVLQLPEVNIKHYCVHTGTRERDEVSFHVGELARDGPHPLSHSADRSAAQDALQQAINTARK